MHLHIPNLSLLATDALLSIFHRFFRNNPHYVYALPNNFMLENRTLDPSQWDGCSVKLQSCHCELHPEETAETISFPTDLLYSELLWAWSQNRINNKTQPHIYTLLSFAWDDSGIMEEMVMWSRNTEYCFYLPNKVPCFSKSLSTQYGNQTKWGLYGQDIREAGLGEREKKITNSLNILKTHSSSLPPKES